MGMGDDDVLHLGGIKAKLFQAPDNDILRVADALVSYRMIPSLVVSAQVERDGVPIQYRSSNASASA